MMSSSFSILAILFVLALPFLQACILHKMDIKDEMVKQKIGVIYQIYKEDTNKAFIKSFESIVLGRKLLFAISITYF